MLGIAFINEIVGRNTELEAHSILQQLRHNVIKALNQEEGADTTKDGMDIALLLVDFDTKTLQYSGAYNPLYLLRQGEIAEYKADRMPIGVHSRDNQPFTNHIIPLLEGDQLYIFTDGFSDQFGGDQGKKMNYTRFKSLLKEQENQLPAAQRTHLLHAFENWKGNHEQLDDVLVIGITV
jgi:serine phosphatase RsbU (regulator of sigma subunit)